MLPRLEAEEALRSANLAFATNGQQMAEDHERAMMLAELQGRAGGSREVASMEDIRDAGILVAYERRSGPADGENGAEVILPPGVAP